MTTPSDVPLQARLHQSGPSSVLARLHEQCTEVVETSTAAQYDSLLGESYVFVSDLELWRTALAGQREVLLLETASEEYMLSMLTLCQGQYRSAFKGLRLVLELCLQAIHLSANLLQREEWLNGKMDTVWASLVDVESGPLSNRFCMAFFPELSEHVLNFRALTKTLYRELSECIHGNVPHHIPLPSVLAFSPESFALWHAKARLVRLAVHFALTLRYLRTLEVKARADLESTVLDQLGHIDAVRNECSKERTI